MNHALIILLLANTVDNIRSTTKDIIRHTTPTMINIRFQDNRAVPRSRHCNRIDPRNCFPSVCCVHACMVDVAVVRLPPSPRLKPASHARLVLITIKIVDLIIHGSCFDNTVACEYRRQNKKHNKEYYTPYNTNHDQYKIPR